MTLRRRTPPPGPQPTGRPIEVIAADVRRLGRRFHTLEPRTAYIKVEAVRAGYDRALAECGDTLGVSHLLRVLAPGTELDSERARVEWRLAVSGVELPFIA